MVLFLSVPDSVSNEGIFDLKNELPGPKDEAERQLILQLDQLAKKIDLLLAGGHHFPEEELHVIFELKSSVKNSPQAVMILAIVLMKLGEHNVQNDLLSEALAHLGEYQPYFLYRALALAKLERLPEAVDEIQKLIATGLKSYEVFMLAARWKRDLKDDRGCIAMANLAVYENKRDEALPFVMMAGCFERLGELEKMLECFARVESIVGVSKMSDELGELYAQHGTMFQRVKNLRDQNLKGQI